MSDYTVLVLTHRCVFSFVQRILTYEYVQGITIDHVDELLKMNFSLKDVSTAAFELDDDPSMPVDLS